MVIMVTFKNNEKWSAVYITVDTDRLNTIDLMVESAINDKLVKNNLMPRKNIDILDVKVISNTFVPSAGIGRLELLVFVSEKKENTQKNDNITQSL